MPPRSPYLPGVHGDQRRSEADDQINLLLTFQPVWEIRTKWLAIRLYDGSYDGALYDRRVEAIEHQLDESLCAYVCMGTMLNGAKPLDCAIFLEFSPAGL